MRKGKIHPHACGENEKMVQRKNIADGSPPQVWGNLSCYRRRGRRRGFTPTGVGKSDRTGIGSDRFKVHPHRCGEILASCHSITASPGSPPQVWGNHGERERELTRRRFTPTGVGKSLQPGLAPLLLAVHPHRCGEITDKAIYEPQDLGSPPQVGKSCVIGKAYSLP